MRTDAPESEWQMAHLGEQAKKTFRYLRLSMVIVIVMLAVSVLIERLRTDEDCWETSISAYYYTPVQAVLVGALVSIGVCMVALKGARELEDILLNIGGMLAPVVAFVPIANPGSCRSDSLVPEGEERRLLRESAIAAVENNVLALLVAGGLGLASVVYLAVREHRRAPTAWDPLRTVGIAVSGLVYAAAAVWFGLGRASFLEYAHYAAALALFACIVGVVGVNALDLDRQSGRTSRRFSNRYWVVAGLMVGSLAVIGLVGWLVDWRHVVLVIETVLIALFAGFFVIQTKELWDAGLRGGEVEEESTGVHT